jgi:hypothetical protein
MQVDDLKAAGPAPNAHRATLAAAPWERTQPRAVREDDIWFDPRLGVRFDELHRRLPAVLCRRDRRASGPGRKRLVRRRPRVCDRRVARRSRSEASIAASIARSGAASASMNRRLSSGVRGSMATPRKRSRVRDLGRRFSVRGAGKPALCDALATTLLDIKQRTNVSESVGVVLRSIRLGRLCVLRHDGAGERARTSHARRWRGDPGRDASCRRVHARVRRSVTRRMARTSQADVPNDQGSIARRRTDV